MRAISVLYISSSGGKKRNDLHDSTPLTHKQKPRCLFLRFVIDVRTCKHLVVKGVDSGSNPDADTLVKVNSKQ